MKSFEGKVVWITGASSGIGRALAEAYSNAGAYTIISARREKLLLAVKNGLKCPDTCLVLPLDLSQHFNASLWTQKALAFKGRVDILVNNGGIGHLGRVEEMDFEAERKVMEVNFWAAAALTKAVLPSMLERNSGEIWTVASILAYFGSPKLAAYAASKFAVAGYFESLQYELESSDVHTGILSPGFINTAVTLSSLGPDGMPIGKNSVAQEKGMSPKELAHKFLRKTKKSNPPKQVIIGKYERFAVPFKRLFPSIFRVVYGKLTNVTRK
ncbi:MAG TPA: short-chain dehydrogenase [Cryomorphaceae bacterium]|nr:short-chain dehydrogenase [Cryomorphaceae bacterium]|tara:strand:+ start:1673 stop:2482 length:810 start_codon:yes stop_codon:yes gene_type:complete